MLSYVIEYARHHRHIDTKIQMILKEKPPSSYEFIQVKMLTHEELKLLMRFCGIRVIEEVPVASATDDEMRMAYMVWRGQGVRERVKSKKKLTSFAKRRIKDIRQFIHLGGAL